MPGTIRVLFITMEFPPVNTTGNYRALKFVKYLHEFGIDPIVVTFKEEQGAALFNTKIDASLLHEIPKGTAVYRIDSDYENIEVGRLMKFIGMVLRVNDSLAKRWLKYFNREIDRIIAQHNPQLIFVSLPPFSSGQLAAKVAKKHRLPLITDMRDLWSQWGNATFLTIVHYWLTVWEERSVFKKSTRVIGVTPQLVSQFQSSHPRLNRDKFHLIPNGFDIPIEKLEDFEFKPGPKVVIGYVGSFYYHPENDRTILLPWWRRPVHRMLQFRPVKEEWIYRSPYFFFRSIRQLLDEFPRLRNIVECHFVGHKPEWFDGMVEEFSLSDHVVSHGFVSSTRASELQDSFDLILATSEKVNGSEHYCLPSKLFDYVGKKKPILGFVTPGIQRDFIRQSGLGVVCDPDDHDRSVALMRRLIENGAIFKPNKDYLTGFHRRRNAMKLADLITSVITSENSKK